MIDEQLQEKLLEVFDKRFQDYNTKVLEELGNVIKQFKDLSPSEAYKLGQQLKYNTTIKDLLNELSKISGMSIEDLEKVLEKVAKENLSFADVYYKARGLDTPIYEQNKALQRLVNSVYKVAGEEFKNISKTAGFRLLDNNGNPLLLDIDKTYKEVIDRCIIAVSQGKETYQQAMRSTLKQLSNSGVRKLEFESGYSRRLDSSIRMNILDSIRQVSNESQQLFGKEFDSDGVEISVHLNPAPDHELVQGRQFSNEEFDNFQNDRKATDYTEMVFEPEFEGHDRRSISEYNCYHYIFSIVLGVSKPQYSNEQLQEIIDNKNKTFEFDGKTYNMYEGTQLQRRIETAIRQEKDTQILAKASGDEEQVLKSQLRITQLNTKYKQLSQISGLPTKKQRMSVSNYRKVSTKNVEKRVQKVYNTGNLYRDTNLYIQARKRQKSIRNGEVNLTIKKDKQLQHFINDKKYIEDKSYFNEKYSNIDKIQKLVNEKAGTGWIPDTQNDKLNTSKERITTDEKIGTYIATDENGKIILKQETNSFIIHYSKKGVHIVPAPNREEKK